MNLSNLILTYYPSAKYYLGSNDYDDLIWDCRNTDTLPTLEQLQALQDADELLLKRQDMVLTASQVRLNLKAIGKLSDVNAIINTLPEDNDMRILWEFSPEFHRMHSVLDSFCKTTLGLSDIEIDALFYPNL